MASDYSTSLKIELIADGEQAGNWGTTTNTNLGTALEEAIVGYGNPDFTSDADLTLTLSNSNATQVARNLVLNVTSSVSLTTTHNLVVPTIEKPYVVQNNTTGGQSIIVKTSGGSGVTIPNGKSAAVYADGTDVVSQIDHIPSLTLGAALPVASGGTGAATFTSGALLKGNGTSAVSSASAADIVSALGTTPVNEAAQLTTTGYTIEESGGELLIKYGATSIGKIDSSGNLTVIGNVTAYGTL
jgi:hypothetical protein